MFRFDFQRTAIHRVVRIVKNPFFQVVKIKRIIFLLLSVLFCLLFWVNNFISFFGEDYDFLLGFALIFFIAFVICWLLTSFVHLKLKHPKMSKATPIINLAEFFSFETADALDSAIKFSKKKKIFPINPTVFLFFLLERNPELSLVLTRLLLNTEEISQRLRKYFPPQKFHDKLSAGVYSQKFEQTVDYALNTAQSKGHKYIEAGDMLFALSIYEPILSGFLLEADLRPDDVRNAILWQEEEQARERQHKRFWDYDNLSRKGSIGRSWSAGYTITLDQYAIDYSQLVLQRGMDHVIGYGAEIEQAERVLSSPEINNVLLVGRPGVGMENIIRAITLKGIKGQSLSGVNYQRVMELKIPQLLAHLQSVEKVEEILDKIFQEVANAGNIILIIDNFHNFIGSKNVPGTIDISGLLASYLNFPQFQLIAITSYSGLHKRIEENPSILNLFSKVEVKEPSVEETLRFLQRLAPSLERKYNIFISYLALKEVVDLTDRYIVDVPFPKKAKEVLQETVVRVAASQEKWVLPKHVHKIISQKTEVPVGKVETKERELLLNLEDSIHRRIINQEEAVREVSMSLRRARARLKARKGPIGDFLFLGPTGVGKTETSKALAEIYFGSEDKMLRLDMSEFQSKSDISRLIGSSGEEGLLTTPVRENPFSLILLDELEKAHPDILNIFLQVLDDGHITDGLGRKIDFRNVIVIATSNAGYKVILEALKNNLDFSKIKQKLLDELFDQGIFRPEFINRFDAVVIFKPLSKQNLLDIAHLMLAKIQKGMEKKNIEFVITEQLKETVVELGYDVTFGARNLQRTIQDKIENPLAEALLRQDIKKGDRIEVTAKRFKVKILKQQKSA